MHKLAQAYETRAYNQTLDLLISQQGEISDDGGYIVFEGTPEEIIKCKDSITGKYLINKLL